MTNIHFPVDGQASQSLKKQNKTDKSPFHVDATTPDTKNQNKQAAKKKAKPVSQRPSDNHEKNLENQTLIRDDPSRTPVSRNPDRRQNNRRKQDSNVLLDTRSEQERRKSGGQREQDFDGNNKKFGIDTEA